ncbi:MAG: M48 family metalloprotease [Pseudomonadales bacterium]
MNMDGDGAGDGPRERHPGAVRRRRRGLLGLLAGAVLLGCVENPITGERELGFVSMAQQISIGEQQYAPAQQMQGGRYQVDEALTGYVQRVGQRVADHSGVELPYEFVVLNNSVPNAWALPGGKLAINRGLLTELRNEAELAAVLGHEIVHAAGRHGAKAIERGVVSQVVMVGVAIGAANTEYAGSALGAAQMAAGLLNQKYGRDAEREADYYGTRFMARAGYDPYAAVTLQETFLRLSEGRSSSWLEGLFSSHPPSAERVANNRSLVADLRAEGFAGGEFGADAYQAALRPLRRDAQAYAAYDEARELLAGDGSGRPTEAALEQAESLLERAIAQQDREAAFHGLRGDLRLAGRSYDAAEVDYDRAIERDDGYFAYYLGRGVARARQGRQRQAEEDFSRSLGLLPTATAYSELGRLAESEGNVEAALRYYQTAAQSSSAVGRAAGERALRLDVPRHPERYLNARLSRDAAGRLVLQVSNATGLPLDDIELIVDTLDDAGRRARYQPTLSRLDGGASRLLLVTDQAGNVVDARATVVAARVAG